MKCVFEKMRRREAGERHRNTERLKQRPIGRERLEISVVLNETI